MNTIIYNENNEIIGEISKSKTDKGYWLAGYDNKNRTRRIIKLFKGKKKAIDFLMSKNINQVTDEELALSNLKNVLLNLEITSVQHLKICQALAVDYDIDSGYIKKLLAPVVREILEGEKNTFKGMSKEEFQTWVQEMLKSVALNSKKL